MKIGRLRHRVQFDSLTTTKDSDDALDEDWSPAFGGAYVSADIVMLSGRELIAAQAEHSRVTGRITVRGRAGVEPSMRVRHRTEVFNIEAVIPDPQSGVHHLTLLVSKGMHRG